MTRFIVEEGGKRRAFKASEGVITIGSGEKAMLKLASPSVAEVHAELVMKEGVVSLRLKPGVVPPQIGGKPAASEQLLALGTVLRIGEASITVAPDEGAVPSAPQAPAPQPAKAGVSLAKQSVAPKHIDSDPSTLLIDPRGVILGQQVQCIKQRIDFQGGEALHVEQPTAYHFLHRRSVG